MSINLNSNLPSIMDAHYANCCTLYANAVLAKFLKLDPEGFGPINNLIQNELNNDVVLAYLEKVERSNNSLLKKLVSDVTSLMDRFNEADQQIQSPDSSDRTQILLALASEINAATRALNN